MGNRLAPRRIHSMEDGRSPYYKYGASQIAGWRLSQEDRYICLPKFHEDFGMFAVYDGHGGGHAVQYLYRFMHQHILAELIKHKDPELALYLGFVTTDLCLRHITKKELDVIDDDLDLEFEVPDKEERRHVIRQFQNISWDSPGTSKIDSSAASSVPGTSQVISQPDLATQDLKAQIASACLSELKSVKFLTEDEMEVDESDEEYDPDKDNIKLDYFGRALDEDEEEDDDDESSESEESVDNEDLAQEPSGDEQSGGIGDEEESSQSKETVDDQNLAKDSNKNEEQSEKEKDCDHDANASAEQFQDCDHDANMKEDEGETKKMDDSDIEICEIPKCSTEESSSKCDNFVEPDSDFCERTGSTATVLLLNDRKLYIANVGDSRCVACVDGKAIDLTVDHKPTKREEKRRIYNAGGYVRDGRVQGVYDLSRTFGDFAFKKKNVAEPFQMLTCEPYITSLEISDKLEFLIIASDGIWNTMNSKDVINLVKNRMEEDAHMELQDICGEVFEMILPTEVVEDGTGCDNFTAILIVFKKQSGYSTPIAGLQECYTYNYSFFNRNKGEERKTTSVQSKSPSPSEKLKNEGQTMQKQCLLETDDSDVPLEPIPISSLSVHGDTIDSRPPSKRFKGMHHNIQLDPHNSYHTDHDNSPYYPLNLVRHASKCSDEKYEPGNSESSAYEDAYLMDILNCFQDVKRFVTRTLDKIEVVKNDLKVKEKDLDGKLTGFLKHPKISRHFGRHACSINLNPSFTSSDRKLTYTDILPLYVGIQPTCVETSRNKSASNQKAPQAATAEVLVVDLSNDGEETHVGDNKPTDSLNEKTSAVDNSVTKAVDSCNALQQKSTDEEPLREEDSMEISTQEKIKEL